MVFLNANGFPHALWRVIPLQTPRVLRHCPKCGGIQRFASSDRFRMNAQQKSVDVWLIYKCEGCDRTWNCTIVERCTVETIGGELYQRFQENNRELAWSYAFDQALLLRNGVRVDMEVEVSVECSGLNGCDGPQNSTCIRIELAYPGIIRLDRLLTRQLKVSRSCVQDWHARGTLRVVPEEQKALQKAARSGQVIFLAQPPEFESLRKNSLSL